MHPPKNAEVVDFGSSLIWTDESGIVYIKSTKEPSPDIESLKEKIQDFKFRFGDKKWCFLLDVTNRGPVSKELRDFSAKELPKLIKAMAIISQSALGKMIANLFFAINKQPYPAKMFNSEEEAKNWLKQYL
jgi:hypothetical protein